MIKPQDLHSGLNSMVTREMVMKNFTHKVIVIMSSVACYGSAFAATQSTMTNTVTISSSCSISTLGFTTTYDPVGINASAGQSAIASVTTTCTLLSQPVVTLGQGANASASSTDAAPIRRLSNGSTFLNYGLFQDAVHTSIWGNTTTTSPVAVPATGIATPIIIYANIPSGQAAKASTYTDTVIATVTF